MSTTALQTLNMLLFFAQLAYYICMIVFVGYAVVQIKRYVNFRMGVGHSGQIKGAGDKPAAENISVEEFVE